MLQAVHPDDRDEVREAWANAIATGTVFTHQHRLRRPDGTYAWVLSRAVPIPSTDRMGAMIGDVLDFARGRLGGGIPIKRIWCDFGRIAIEEADEMRQAFPGRSIQCETTGDMGGEWDAHRGTIDVSSSVDGGTTFTVELPRVVLESA